MNKYFAKVIAAKKKQIEEARKRVEASTDVEEVRALGETLMNLKAELDEAEKQLAALEEAPESPAEDGAEAAPASQEEGRSAHTSASGFNPLGTYKQGASKDEARSAADANDPTNTAEYRSAFMKYVMSGEKSEVLEEARANASTTTADVGSVIPRVLIDKIIEKSEAVGMILPLVTKTQYAAGVEIPVSSLKPVATWVAEGAGSDRQKKTTDKIVFTHHKLRCEVSVSMEVGTMALAAFEAKLVENVAEAMVKAKEFAIIAGTGTGQPKGILTETPAEGQAITLTSGTDLTYEILLNAEAALPQQYEMGARWCMSKKTFYAFQGIKDAAGQPIARVNFGIGGAVERSLLGREVVLCGDYMPSYAKAPTAATTFAFMFDFSEYCLNSVYDMGISRKQDWDTEDMLTKAVTACDGKVADKNSLVTLTINNA